MSSCVVVPFDGRSACTVKITIGFTSIHSYAKTKLRIAKRILVIFDGGRYNFAQSGYDREMKTIEFETWARPNEMQSLQI